MTIAEMLSWLIAPFGALLMAAVVLFITRKDRVRQENTSQDKHTPLPKQSH